MNPPVASEAPAPWPLPFTGTPGPAADASRATSAIGGTYPPVGWPTLGQLSWTKELITVLLLVLALPWLMRKLLTHPGDVLSGLGQRAAGKATGV